MWYQAGGWLQLRSRSKTSTLLWLARDTRRCVEWCLGELAVAEYTQISDYTSESEDSTTSYLCNGLLTLRDGGKRLSQSQATATLLAMRALWRTTKNRMVQGTGNGDTGCFSRRWRISLEDFRRTWRHGLQICSKTIPRKVALCLRLVVACSAYLEQCWKRGASGPSQRPKLPSFPLFRARDR